MIPPQLPNSFFEPIWRKFTREVEKGFFGEALLWGAKVAKTRPGWNPPTVVLGGKLLALDYAFDMQSGKLSSYETIVYDDHPFLNYLRKLPHVPRTVTSLYLKEVRLKHLNATDTFPVLKALDNATESWKIYLEKLVK